MFDSVALTYDDTFTHSSIGLALRSQVYNYLEKVLPKDEQLNILELNCGTGEDALYFAKKGHQVTATDISEGMVKVAREKAEKEGIAASIRCVVSDIRNLSEINGSDKFDLIFSNFGGLNCLNREDLNTLSLKVNSLLKAGGRFIAVVMPKFCLWESMYFFSKFKTENIFRRNTNKSVEVNVGDNKVETWYYSPVDFKRIFINGFQFVNMKPIGIMLPPSYLEPYFSKKRNALNNLEKAENIIGKLPALSFLSDHFLIDFRKI